MRNRNAGWLPVILTCGLSLAGCGSASRPAGPVVVAPGAPGEASRTVDAASSATGARPAWVEADVRFMQDMIRHHAQALEMTSLIAERTDDPAIRRVGQRIDASQQDEIATMRRWLEKRGVAAADDAHAAHHLMPGMLTAEAMAALAAARGDDFDRLFLESMIRHHEGALVMVRDLFATEGAGREPELYQFATHVDADQRAEIARMRSMLKQNEGRGAV